jgi:hypothetical protein
MEHAQEAIEEFHNKPTNKQKNKGCDEDITFLLMG